MTEMGFAGLSMALSFEEVQKLRRHIRVRLTELRARTRGKSTAEDVVEAEYSRPQGAVERDQEFTPLKR